MTSSASLSSFTTMAPRRIGRAPVAPARTSMTREKSPRRSTSPIMFSTTRTASARKWWTVSPTTILPGETPIPCVECNRSIKFRDLLGTARDLGAAALATGHYLSSRPLPDGRRALYQASDESRDQSYFLYATTPAQLDHASLPAWRPFEGRDPRACGDALGLRSPKSRTARTSASSPRAAMPTSSRSCGPAPAGPGRSST